MTLHSKLSDDRMASLLSLAERTRHIPGVVAEVGVFQGGTLRKLANRFPDKVVMGFDTFTGMPEAVGEHHAAGEFYASLADVRRVVGDSCQLVPGLFPVSCDVEQFAFVHLDIDHYQATADALAFLWPRLAPGGIIVLDDYGWPSCPGVKRALDEFGVPVNVSVTAGEGQAWVQK